MKLLRKILTKLILTLITIVIIIGGVGFFSTSHYESQTSLVFEASKDNIWEALVNLRDLHGNQSIVKEIELTGLNADDYQMWREYLNPWGSLDLEIAEQIPGEKMVINLLDNPFGYVGTWTYEIIENNDIGVTTVTISEKSDLTNIFARGLLTMMGRNLYTKNEFRLIENYLKENTTAEVSPDNDEETDGDTMYEGEQELEKSAPTGRVAR